MTSWTRTVQAALPWAAGTSLLLAVPPGQTVLRIRFAWGFSGYTSPLASYAAVAQNAQVLGLCSVVSSATPPNARTQSGDVAPPLQRWLWWEARVPRVSAYSNSGGVVTWENSRPQENVDVRSQVAANVPTGETLQIWASWAPAYVWDSSGAAYLWYTASVLTNTTVG
ncbi:MAG TPA: hypothetical protein VGR84_19260 [Candidatus Acidoferrales bacterium]|nr:hypothetical protein [Candidatus Acidoferrales bacterium]